MEKPLSRWRIFALSNRTNMFHTISWGEYFTVMGLGLGLYYGWWLIRFYPRLRTGRKDQAGREGKVMPGPKNPAAQSGTSLDGKPAENNGKQAGTSVDGTNTGMPGAPTGAEKAGLMPAAPTP